MIPKNVQAALSQIAVNASRPILPQEFTPLGAFFKDEQRIFPLPPSTLFDTPAAVAYTFDVPPGKKAVIGKFGIELNNAAGNGFVTYRFRKNGGNLDNYQAPPFLVGTIDHPSPIFVELDSRNTFTLEIQNLAAAASYQAAWRMHWWAWNWTGDGASEDRMRA